MDVNEFKNKFSTQGMIINERINSFIHIKNGDIDFGGIEYNEYLIQSCEFTQPFEMFHVQFDKDCVLKFDNCLFHEGAQVSLVNVSCSIVYFHNCTFHKGLYLNNLKSSNVSIFKCDIEELDFLYNEVYSFKIENGEGGEIKSLKFNSEKTNYFSIKSKFRIKDIDIFDGQYVDIYSPIQEILVHGNTYRDIVIGGEIYGVANEIERLIVSRIEGSGFITVQNASINFMELESIKTQSGTMILNELEIDKFIMEDCQIKNVQFNIVDFKTECEIIRSNLDGIKVFNVKWLKDRTLTPNYKMLKVPFFQRYIPQKMSFEREPFTNDDLKEMRYQQDSYRQLKAASFANHNTIDGLGFYKNEMRLYWKEIRIKGGESFWDTLLIFMNRWVSNFGQSWMMPLIGLLIGQFLFCTLVWNFQSIKWCGEGTNCSSDLISGFSQYLNWLIPIYKVPDHWTDGSTIVGVIMRVYNGFFIYHFIKASRKFGRV